MMEEGKMIPIAFTKDADAKDIADAIGEFIEKYDSQVNSEIINSKKTEEDVTKRKPERSKCNGDSNNDGRYN